MTTITTTTPQTIKKQIFSFQVNEETPALEFLAENTKLSKMVLKKLFTNGAIWIIEGTSEKRQRKIKSNLNAGTRVRVYYDPAIKEFDIEKVECMHDTHNWGIWYKPAGLLSQGTKYGDAYSILRIIERRNNRPPYLVHRLDRETQGLMIIAYNKKAAAYFSEQIKERKVKKYYQALLLGNLEADSGTISHDIDDQEAVTEYRVLDRSDKYTLVEALLVTGRKHQLRIHFNNLGHPIMGDPKYGENNSFRDGMQLLASKLIFTAPGRNNEMDLTIRKSFQIRIPKE